MIRQCCACKEILGEKAPLDDKRVSHGLCDPCRDRLYPMLNTPLPHTRKTPLDAPGRPKDRDIKGLVRWGG